MRISMLLKSRLFLGLVVAVLATTSTHADWLQFRGPDGGARAEGNVPTHFGGESDENIAWKTPLIGRAVNGPIIVGNQVIATASSGQGGKRLHVMSLDDENGKVQWERRFWATGRTLCHPLSAVAAPTPSSDGERIYALFSSNDLFCLDLEGNLLWTRGLTLEYKNAFDDRGLASSTWLAGDTLIVQVACSGDSFVMGLAPATGKTKWKIPLATTTNWATPGDIVLGDRRLVMIQSADQLMLVDAESGETKHFFESEGNLIPSPTCFGDTVLMPANGMTAVRFHADDEEGEELWRSTKVGAESASPVAVNQEMFLVIRDSGILTAAKIDDGSSLWKKRMEGNGFWATPLVVGGKHAYVVNTNGTVYVFATADGKEVARNELGEEVLGSPAVSGGALYFRSTSSLIKVAPS